MNSSKQNGGENKMNQRKIKRYRNRNCDTNSIRSWSNTVNFDTYMYIDGRKYHNITNNTSTYVLPSDSFEIRRADVAHELYKQHWGSNFSSPVKEKLNSPKGAKVLDCGCGSGRWSYEMAVKYPNSTFVGLDMVPVFSNNDNDDKPLNLGFFEYNICNGLPFEDSTFDFIFQRSMMIALNKSQWNTMLNEFARAMKPGGWLELMEIQVNENNLTRTARKFQNALNKYHQANNHYLCHDFPFYHLLKSTNKFTSIKVIEKKVAVGKWGNDFGLEVADVLIEVYRSIKPKVKRIMNVTDSEYDELLQKLSSEVRSTSNNYMYITTAKAIARRI
ncbi:5390_t:CDS:2 [Funneliformis mosseae]|uniref:5390_t:CDS:1 n=1 Tax=Funneliformis mosseae TaxID=27381 RepID=A0A9N8W358_FUNMO|nr:5390_t:CDS:2 [Funneliformis mosseae]